MRAEGAAISGWSAGPTVKEPPQQALRQAVRANGFDAERAVAYQMQRRDVEEAAWLIFLMTQ
ncbi:hypothetical protein [Mesorhizobium sp. M0185]|uniref:alpha-glutamyl/putrescinyl thymine pyrophosphorylase clade 3 protein n=1 Tax=unclassified Mesorhizobium TaxID=325217 RepID=UPI00333C4C0B